MTPEPPKTTKDKMLFPITGVFRIKGRGTVVCGLVDVDWNGLTKGDLVEVRDGTTVVLRTQTTGVEMFMVNPPPAPGRHPVGVLISTETVPRVVEGQTLWKLSANPGEGT
jgi:translation elongation factor EF-Tu-like GTPase